MARTDQVRTFASVAGVPLGEFRTFNGGELTSEDVKSVRGGGQTERSRGGRKTIGNVTISREWDGEDMLELGRYRGKPDLFVITRQPYDDDGNKRGKALTYTGTLIRIAPGDGDSGGDGLDDLELEMSVSEAA
jgi:hypothetical protein